MKRRQLRGLIFDFDGTMCNSETVWCEALTHAYETSGLVFDRASFWAAVGRPIDTFDSFKLLANHVGRDVASVEAELDSVVVREIAAIGPAPGVRELAEAVRQHGVRLAIASNNTAAHIQVVLDLWDMGHFFDVVVGRERGLPQKPDPAPYICALAELGISADQAVAIEDTASGVDSATAAGLHCFLLGEAAGARPHPEVTRISSISEMVYRPHLGIQVNSC